MGRRGAALRGCLAFNDGASSGAVSASVKKRKCVIDISRFEPAGSKRPNLVFSLQPSFPDARRMYVHRHDSRFDL